MVIVMVLQFRSKKYDRICSHNSTRHTKIDYWNCDSYQITVRKIMTKNMLIKNERLELSD